MSPADNTEKRIATPPFTQSFSGRERHIGVELEYGAVNAADTARIIGELFGGDIVRIDPHKYLIQNTDFGDFTCELDLHYIHPELGEGQLGPLPFQDKFDDRFSANLNSWLTPLRDRLYEWIGDVASVMAPFEIVCPPVPLSRLGELDKIVDALNRAEARDTRSSIFFGFGLQLNPEIADTSASYILSVLRAYVMLSPWLRQLIQVDLTRQVLPFASPFPEDFIAYILQPGYAPDLQTLIRDYLAFNPTRNRELDMLPLFSWLEPQIVEDKVDSPLIKARPTFHYRLPDARLQDKDWHIAQDWNRWVEIEKLAADGERLERMARRCLSCIEVEGLPEWGREVGSWQY